MKGFTTDKENERLVTMLLEMVEHRDELDAVGTERLQQLVTVSDRNFTGAEAKSLESIYSVWKYPRKGYENGNTENADTPVTQRPATSGGVTPEREAVAQRDARPDVTANQESAETTSGTRIHDTPGPPSIVTVRLRPGETDVVRMVAKMRYQNNRNKGYKNKKIGPQGEEVTDLDGLGAEMAFCKVFNLYVDFEMPEGIPPKFDCRLRDLTVDVKQTPYPNGRLLAETWKKEPDKRCDIYVLVTGTLPDYKIVGFVPGDVMFLDCFLSDLGYGPTYAIEQNDLYDVELLKG